MLMTLYLPILGRFGRLSQTSYVEKQQRDNEICIIYNKGLAQPSEPSELFLFISGFTPLRRTCHVSSYLRRTARRPLFLPVLQGCGAHTYGLPPRILCGPSSTKSTSRCFELPPKPPAAGGCAPRLEPKKKLFIQLQSAILPHPSQILLCQRGMGVGYSRHQCRSARRHLLAPFRPGSTHSSFRPAEVRSQIPPRAASYDPQAPATGDVRRALSQERNCAVCALRRLRVHPSQILPCLRGMGGGYYRHGSASAAFAFRSPVKRGRGAIVFQPLEQP